MQTFLPSWSCRESAQALDNQRLGKQRVEAMQILKALTTGKGWIYHPATKMWAGYEGWLVQYIYSMCLEWTARGFEDSVEEKSAALYLAWFSGETEVPPRPYAETLARPWWWFDPYMALSHRSNLLRKDMDRYGQQWPNDPHDLEYIWPKGAGHTNEWFISKPGLKRVAAGELRDPRTVKEIVNG